MRMLGGYCFNCDDGSGTGYIDCPMSCSTSPTSAGGSYIRDGDLYTASFNPNAAVSFGTFLQISILIILACISLIVWLNTDKFSFINIENYFML